MNTEELTEHRLAMLELDYQIRSNRPIIYICTYEENRVLDAIRAICNRDDRKKWELFTWDVADGLSVYSGDTKLDSTSYDQSTVLGWFAKQSPAAKDGFQILLLKDYYKFMGNDDNAGQVEHEIVRQLRNQSHINISEHKCVIIMGTSLYLPPELEKMCAVIDWPLPERQHILEQVSKVIDQCKTHKVIKNNFCIEYSEFEMDEIVTAFQGLTLIEIELLCSYMVLTTKKFDSVLIANKKRDIIRKSGLVDWVDVENDINSIGGLYELKDWLIKRKSAFTKEARDYGLPSNPKGVLLVGIQGGGKSLAAQAIASFWNLPLLKLDMGKIFAGIVGSSEENIRNAISVAESISPCVLWLDEMDKGLAGTRSSNNTDGGTAARVFGSLLNWMQEKKKPVYIAATANDVSQLPAELLRKGRFDEIFFVDLPTEEERYEIFKIHLEKRLRKSEDFDLDELVKSTDGYTGAEIESIIISSMYEAFYDNKREITNLDISNSIQETVPLSITMQEHIKDLRSWAKTRARNASFSPKKHYHKHVTIEEESVEEEEL
jgi:hypothetical protein